jgi:GR25 family glycosyltransferase involved in LPS biosynthesis
MTCQTPITYFIYNRSEKTKRSFESIRRARPIRLIIVADGPKDEKDRLAVAETRAVVEHIDWECEVTRLYSEKNMGCALRVSSGITEVFSIVDRIIILEDDIVASEDFFVFQEQMLERYKDDDRVMMVTGWNSFVEYPIEGYSGFFSKSSAIWGWGTWRRAWSFYRFDPLENGEEDANMLRQRLDSYMDDPFWVQYHLQCMDARVWSKLDTWDYQWALTLYAQHGISVTPVRNLCLNIGFDEQATNTKSGHPATFMSHKFPEGSFGKEIAILESCTIATDWYDRARLMLYLLMMQGDLRILYLFHKHPHMLPDGPERKGWELYLGVFKHPQMCLDILDVLEKHLDNPYLKQIREVLKRI